MTNKNIDIQILKIFPTAKKFKEDDEDVRYQIDDRTKLYLFNQSNTIFKMGIILGIESKSFLIDDLIDNDFYIDFQFQNDSLVIDDKFPWSYSSESSGKVNLKSLKEIVLFLRKEWENYNNPPEDK